MRGRGLDADLALAVGREAECAVQGLLGKGEPDLTATPPLPTPREPAQGLGAEDVDQLVGPKRLQRGFGRRAGRLARLLGTGRRQRIGELEEVGLARAVLTNEDVRLRPKSSCAWAKQVKLEMSNRSSMGLVGPRHRPLVSAQTT